MNASRTTYRVTTGIITFVMLFSIYKMFSPAYAHLGFPDYFRIELTSAKLLGLAVLLVPQAPRVLKEWAYAGFAIVLVSAAIAHLGSGDPAPSSLEPLGFLAVLLVSHRTLRKLPAASPPPS